MAGHADGRKGEFEADARDLKPRNFAADSKRVLMELQWAPAWALLALLLLAPAWTGSRRPAILEGAAPAWALRWMFPVRA